jgi:hypothetical protein
MAGGAWTTVVDSLDAWGRRHTKEAIYGERGRGVVARHGGSESEECVVRRQLDTRSRGQSAEGEVER